MPTNEVEPVVFICGGCLGDLSQRKLLPALYQLSAKGKLDDNHAILGIDTDDQMDDQGFRAWARARLGEAGLPVDDETSRWCDRRLYYHSIGAGTKADYRVAAARIESIEKERDLPGNRVFYLALPADVVPNAIANAGQVGLNRSPGWTRIVMEKPFGRDLASAQQLNLDVHRYFDESQIYRIDHFLGKETVQNLLVFRFGNVFFEKIWNRENVESVEITVAEDVGVEKRTGYYEHAGALRDMIQNHLTQLLTLVAPPPSRRAPSAPRSSKYCSRSLLCASREMSSSGSTPAARWRGRR
jgi:glucose-6-phosphate 1-dehydrogenase